MGQKWGLVRTDLSIEILQVLTDGVSDAFYLPMLQTYTKGKPPTEETLLLQDLLGRTLRVILRPVEEDEMN